MSKDLTTILGALFEYNIDFRKRRLYLDEEICEITASYLIKGLHALEAAGNGPIELWINCPGGTVVDGLAIYDALRMSPCFIRTVGLGTVASMATVVFLAGQERVLMPECEFMVHPVSLVVEGSFPDVKITTKRIEQLEKQMNDIYVKRTKKRRPFWVGINRDRYISPKDCVEFGIAHEIEIYPEED